MIQYNAIFVYYGVDRMQLNIKNMMQEKCKRQSIIDMLRILRSAGGTRDWWWDRGNNITIFGGKDYFDRLRQLRERLLAWTTHLYVPGSIVLVWKLLAKIITHGSAQYLDSKFPGMTACQSAALATYMGRSDGGSLDNTSRDFM